MHKPVLLKEIITLLNPQTGGIYIDGTVGAGGHATAILKASAPDGQLLGLDQDKEALTIARNTLKQFGNRVQLSHTNFIKLSEAVKQHHIPLADGILFDLGVSSMQLNQPERGFSFQTDGLLDMRMNRRAEETAASLINSISEKELSNLIYEYGEERFSRRIAKAIIKARPVERTTELARIVSRVTRKNGRAKIHPATLTFQAIRIAVNDELNVLRQVLPQALKLLKPGGKLAVISFHSLEDRIVKRYFRKEAQDCICPPEQLICVCEHKARINIITKKPIIATKEEIKENPRGRSAKLRVVELKRDEHYVK